MEDVKGATSMTWEELEDCGELDRRLQKIAQQPSKFQSQSCQSITLAARPKDGSRNTSTPPVRILKRQPNSDPCLAATEARVAQARPIRTLEEREAAYAEARLRILGPAASTETNANAVNLNNLRRSPNTSTESRTTQVTNGAGGRS
jgi:hypothetical protein